MEMKTKASTASNASWMSWERTHIWKKHDMTKENLPENVAKLLEHGVIVKTEKSYLFIYFFLCSALKALLHESR